MAVVVGLGGGGAATASIVRDMDLENVACAELDIDSPIFEGFYSGYVRDVVPRLHSWASTSTNNREVLSWFDVNEPYSPLMDIPDMFVRRATRPMMRASLMMQRPTVDSWARNVAAHASTVILTTQTHGATGSAWIHEMKSIFEEVSPEIEVHLVLIHTRENMHWSSERRSLRNQFWTLREISADENLQHRLRLVRSQTDAVATIVKMLTPIGSESRAGDSMNIDHSLLELGSYISKHFSEPHSQLDFMKGRCAPISSMLTEVCKHAIAGLLLARSESRISDSLKSSNLTRLSFRTRESGIERSITLLPAMDLFRGLALSHPGLGSPEHVTAFDVLATEGLGALAGLYSVLGNEIQQRLDAFQSSLEQELFHARQQVHQGRDSAEIADVYPIVLDQLRQIIGG